MTQSVAVPLQGFPHMASDGLVTHAFRRDPCIILTVFIPLACNSPQGRPLKVVGLTRVLKLLGARSDPAYHNTSP